LLTAPYVAEIVAVVELATLVVAILNFADVAPSGTMTLAEGVADASELFSLTTAPPTGAGPFRYTVFAEELAPPAKVVGYKVINDTATGFTVIAAVFVTPPHAAEIVTAVVAATFVVVIVNFIEVAPAGTTTVAGTAADGSELLKATTMPAGGAGAFRYTALADDGTPPTNAVGYKSSDETKTGFSVRVAVFVTPPYAAEMVTLTGAATLAVVILKLAEVAPAETMTLAGTAADASELFSVTTAPVDGAGPFRLTVFAVDVTPPMTAVGYRMTDVNPTGFTVIGAVFVTPPHAAEIVAAVVAPTLLVVIVNFTDVAPAGTVTVAGTAADGSELLNVTTAPLDGAGPFRYTALEDDGTPPTNAVGYNSRDASATGLSVRIAVFLTPPYAAEIVTVFDEATLVVLMPNVAEVAPATMFTLAGTVADGSELVNVTRAPVDGAGAFR
jgi:hypothetical protein